MKTLSKKQAKKVIAEIKKSVSRINKIKLMAKFMGFEYVKVGYFGLDDETEWQVKNSAWMDSVEMNSVGEYIVNIKENKWHEWDHVKYDSSWEWIMPVVEKIRLLGYSVDIHTFYFSKKHPVNNGCRITYEKSMTGFFFNENTDDLKKCIVETIIEFIEWYNTNKKA